MPELPLDRCEHRVEVGEIADVCAHDETSGSKCLAGRPQRPFIQAADGHARALSVEFLRCGEPDPAVAAGDEDILVRQPTHCRHITPFDFILQFDSAPTETLLPLARCAGGETTTTSPSFNPSFISIPVSVSWPRMMPTR